MSCDRPCASAAPCAGRDRLKASSTRELLGGAPRLIDPTITRPQAAPSGARGPAYYRETGLQPWDAMQQWLSREQFIGFLRGNAIKYLARAGRKGDNAAERADYAKAQHYLEKINEILAGPSGDA